jgi:hypothetical protein
LYPGAAAKLFEPCAIVVSALAVRRGHPEAAARLLRSTDAFRRLSGLEPSGGSDGLYRETAVALRRSGAWDSDRVPAAPSASSLDDLRHAIFECVDELSLVSHT